MGAKGLQTRRRLMAAIEDLLRTTPLRDLRVAKVVRLAGTSTATFYVYFDDVPDAVLALIRDISQSPPSLLSVFAEPWGPDAAYDRAFQFAAAYVEQWQAHAALFRVRNLASDEGDWRFSETRANAVAPLISAMAARIAERREAGALPADLDAVSAACAVIALVERIAGLKLAAGRSQGVTHARLLHAAAFFTVTLFAGEDGRGPGAGRVGRLQAAASVRTKPLRPNPGDTEAQGGVVASSRINHQGQTMGAKGTKTRERLMEATHDLLRTKPLRELSVADIAKRAKTSTSTFYLYFADVPEAVLAVIGQVTLSTPSMLGQLSACWRGATPEDAARKFVHDYVGHWRTHDALFRVRNLAADEGDARFGEARYESIRALLALIADRVAERQGAGELPQDLHANSAAGALLAMLERIAVTPTIDRDGPVTLETISRAAAIFVTTLVGVAPVAGSSPCTAD
jgi:AcrR family transcriptional regulator